MRFYSSIPSIHNSNKKSLTPIEQSDSARSTRDRQQCQSSIDNLQTHQPQLAVKHYQLWKQAREPPKRSVYEQEE